MRTRIALVATIPAAVMTVSIINQAASAQPVVPTVASQARTHPSTVLSMPADKTVAYRSLRSEPAGSSSGLPFVLGTGFLALGVDSSTDRSVPLTVAVRALYEHRTAPVVPVAAKVAPVAPVAPVALVAPVVSVAPVPARVVPVAPVVTKVVPVAAAVPAPPAGPADTVTPYERAAWERVAMCEEGGDWQSDGPEFSGGLGISRANWDAYGGLQYAPEGAEATEDQQIMVAERIQPDPPDQYGCRGW